jgi:hypothetical protein
MPSRYSTGALAALFSFLLLLAHPLAAAAAGEDKASDAKGSEASDPAVKIQQLNRAAMQYFDDLNYAMAEKTLLEALALVEKANLGSGPAGLATNGNLAVLYSAGFKKPDKAVLHFKKALAIKPDLKLSKQRATPETEANLARAKAEMGGGGAAPAAGGPKAGAASLGPQPAAGVAVNGLSCPTGGETQAGEEITFKCTTGGMLRPATVMLYFKPNDSDEYQALLMTKEGTSGGVTNWVAKIPGTQTMAGEVWFFFEANDASGGSLALSGREDSPSVITVRGSGVAAGPPPVAGGGGEGEEEEEEEGEEIDDSNPLAGLERERWKEHHGSKGSWLVSIGAGSGLGYAYGHLEAFGKYKLGFNPGIAPASLGHAVWEVAYFVGRNTALSIGGRHQWIIGGPAGTATGAHSLLLRSLFFTEDEGKVRWYFALAAGGGEGFRLRVVAQINDPDTGAATGYTVKDTVRGGPFVAGFGGGMLYKLSRRMHLTVDTQFLAGFLDFSAVLDLTAGVRWQF